ncbi:hypothetical protein B0G62_102144 [Paraburkholderia eburnea]|uniref:Uncharacterized protein n=1 Tax=Paraburkholderia eburnea TaxID=1189126 RepID=A0A2S4MIF1_9BURK|nr:hypothetical protein [Paraburkholderia eburnea]POR54536.1 hypothetical protein B0G62_102144 [Paraburkholderia eburnea]PRZ19751.1 hypothetical protein BX588_114144 [Paraburkholderia eburnea]
MGSQQKIEKTKEALEIERAEIETLRGAIEQLCWRPPQRVLAGSYQTAVAWKELAIGALRLAKSKAPTLAKLRNARDAMVRAQTE